jgi:hypothetical protein
MGEYSGLSPLQPIVLGDSGHRELDSMHRELGDQFKAMIQMATLVALKARQHGHREAEARIRETNARVKETRERLPREAREAKAKDPRNLELGRMMDGTARWLAQQPRTITLDRAARAVDAPARTRAKSRTPAPAKQQVRDARTPYDSTERRSALARDLAAKGLDPRLIAVRMLMEAGQAQPARVATRTVPGDTVRRARVQEIDARGRVRER